MERFLQGIVTRLQAVFDPEVIGDGLALLLADLLVGLLIFAGFYLLWRLIGPVAHSLLRRSRVDEMTADFAETMLKYGLLIVGAVQGLGAAGVNTAAVVASLGLAGLTVGFAARDALSNIISGLLIFWDRPFVIGDLVEVGDHYGRVSRITLRSTRVVTVDGRMLAVPNSAIINSTVASYTNFPTLRLDIDVTIDVAEDIDRAREVLLGLVADLETYLDAPAPRVVVTALNDYNVALQLQVWLRDERRHIPERFELRERVFKALTEAGVEMPFETIRVAKNHSAPTDTDSTAP